MCSIDDGEMPQFYNETNATARKPHKCCECDRVIPTGEKYLRIEGKWDGDFLTFKQCTHCVALYRWFQVVCGGSTLSGLAYDLVDHWDEYGELPLGRLLVLMRRKWDGATPSDVTEIVQQSAVYNEVKSLSLKSKLSA